MDGKKTIDLKDYIEENHKLLSTLGVFIALTIFFANIDLKSFAPWFSFLSLTCVVLIWLELWSKFPEGNGNWILVWFENVLSYLILASLIYWIVKFQTLYQEGVTLLIALVLMAIISSVLKKTNLFNKLFKAQPDTKKVTRYILGIIILIIVFLISFKIAELISPLLNNAIEQIKSQN